MAKALTRDDILGVTKRDVRAVDVPEWSGTVYVRVLSGAERDRLAFGTQDGSIPAAELRLRVCAAAICDEDGASLFSVDDLEALGSQDWRALERVWDAAAELSGFGDDGAGELEKNFGETPSDDSGSD